ncbi:glycosyltransferase [Bacillus benzoevorans]|uniref:Glycosyltransferase involved in cell wall biosynthesis n=1 Tax=Bacillus benzoevorans TaxID=1456 RepID=A0A7X0HU24_9BACI|nr:glycosyltransferase [Bacillus benzoevorans]MBB6446843.1 glycosyltransferase involved in cell wall biosynthesis [Bacillus benzoevorans]
MDHLISIIVPVYNAESYLKKCLESIVRQTYRNLEIILIDDGSEDNSPHICDEYAMADDRVKVLHKENAGPGAARRDGVHYASGEYIAFVDADDFIEQNMYQTLIERAVADDIDIIQCGYRKVKTTGETIEIFAMRETHINGSYHCAAYYAAQRNVTNYLCNKMMKSKLFAGIEFPGLYVGEDACILTQLYASAEKITTIEEPLYNYVMTPDSLCRTPFSVKKLDNVAAGKFMFEFYEKRFPNLRNFSALHICSYAAQYYCELSNLEFEAKDELKDRLVKVFQLYYPLSKKSHEKRQTSKSRILFIELFHFNRLLCSFIFKTRGRFSRFPKNSQRDLTNR